ncbi:hypothetical protein A3860_05050 [Niastella vici]|uniref:Glycosyltransferase 2-like domain-containing protein n=2 Tax=Niastella vici TaxID=1703345 RepID=A0A1V9FRY9_9BACT|nr:hypothetical protein A3860_05050 [Niastella vici]
MTCSDIVQGTKLKWYNNGLEMKKDICLLVPQFNEGGRENFLGRLDYFRELAREFKDHLDIILIDDGSTDGSFAKIDGYLGSHPDAFFFASVSPNANKVGALSQVALSVSHEFIILSDFDTNLDGLKDLLSKIDLWRANDSHMGYFFRLVPFEGSGKIFQYQQLEYCLARVRYKFHQRVYTVPVMPGAGCCFKRDILNTIYSRHSGLRNGEDREATMIGRRLGYSVSYLKNVQALTRTPLTMRALIKQRVRWNLGYLETVYFERRQYWREIQSFSVLGMRTLLDMFSVFFILALPFILLIIGMNGLLHLALLSTLYIGFVSWCYALLQVEPEECAEFRPKLIPMLLLFPLIKLCIDYTAWLGAFRQFAKNKYSGFGSRYV